MGILTGQAGSYVPPPAIQMPAQPPPPPTPVDKAAEDAAQQTRARLASAGGASGTNVTGGQGVTAPANLSFKTLLGQ